MKEFYLPSLDGIRACAFLLVFIAHAGLENIVPGGLGVTIFFFLSGYLITTLLRREIVSTGDVSIRKFYLRRCLRILPPMYITLAVGCAAAWFLPSMRSETTAGILSVFTYTYNYAALINDNAARLPAGMGVFWSLMIEEHFYLIFPLVYLCLSRSRLSKSWQGLLLGSACASCLAWRFCLVLIFHTPLLTLPRWTYSSTDTRFDAIAWGCILAICWNPVFRDGPAIANRNRGKLALAGLSLLFLTLIVRNPVFRETARYSLQSVALFPIFHYCIALPDSFVSRCLQLAPLRWIGLLSYSMYLIHDFLLAILRMQFHGSPPAIVLSAFLFTALYALTMRFCIEKPSRTLQRLLTRPRRALHIPHPVGAAASAE